MSDKVTEEKLNVSVDLSFKEDNINYLAFERPEYKMTEYIEGNNYGKFVLEPLERGFGTTIGNALRRILLSSLPGDAITSVKIEGVMHEFQTIEGVIEDVTSIVLNLKKIVVKKNTNEAVTVKISVKGEGELKASVLAKEPTLEIINPDQTICTLAEGGKLEMELTIGRGRGYLVADEVKQYLTDTTKPIRIITTFGFVIAILSLIGIIWSVITFALGKTVAGWASLVTIIFFFSGIQLLSLGVIGEYIGKIYLETKARPRFIIEKRAGDFGRTENND